MEDLVSRPAPSECITWPFAKNVVSGYPYAMNVETGNAEQAGKVMWQMVNGPWPEGLEAAHTCFNGHLACCNWTHLRPSTHAENMEDMVIAGRSQRGSRHSLAKLTEADIVTIFEMRVRGMTTVAIAQEFGVHWVSISKILKRETWTRVDTGRFDVPFLLRFDDGLPTLWDPPYELLIGA